MKFKHIMMGRYTNDQYYKIKKNKKLKLEDQFYIKV